MKLLSLKSKNLGGIDPTLGKIVSLELSEVKAIESSIGAELPSEYRYFVMKFGSCSFGELVRFQTQKGRKQMFSYFYGPESLGIHVLKKELARFKGRMPDLIIPIGNDGTGGQICIGVAGKEAGCVYFWDNFMESDGNEYYEEHGKPMSTSEKFKNIEKISDSFLGFLGSLEVAS